MVLPIECVSLYEDLKKCFEGIEKEQSDLQKYYKKLKNEGIDEIDLIEVQCSDDVNTYKDYVRSVCSIVDKHLENGLMNNFKEISPY